MLEFLLRAYRLKDESRQGWLRHGVKSPESVADHSWGTALLCLLYGEDQGIDLRSALEIALVHDLAESITGDVPTNADVGRVQVAADDKGERELRAMHELLASQGPALVMERWQEYEARETPEARFVSDMNLVDMCVQALAYERSGRHHHVASQHTSPLGEFFASARTRVYGDGARRLVDELEAAYRQATLASRPAPVSLAAVADAIEAATEGADSFLDLRTGEVIDVMDPSVFGEDLEDQQPDFEDLEGEHYLALPDAFDRHDWGILRSFCEAVEDDVLRERLLRALHGSGAFRRTKDLLSQAGLLDSYFAHRDEIVLGMARDWLDEHGVPYQEA